MVFDRIRDSEVAMHRLYEKRLADARESEYPGILQVSARKYRIIRVGKIGMTRGSIGILGITYATKPLNWEGACAELMRLRVVEAERKAMHDDSERS